MRSMHEDGPFTVTVTAYRIAPRVDLADTVEVYASRHRQPKAAARRLAAVISRRTQAARDIQRGIPQGYSGRFVIRNRFGKEFALVPFRRSFVETA